MRKNKFMILTGIITSILFILIGCGSKTETEAESESTLVADDFLVDYYGETKDVIAEIGENYDYFEGYFAVVAGKDSKEDVATHRGIRLGDSVDKVFDAYGEMSKEEEVSSHMECEEGEDVMEDTWLIEGDFQYCVSYTYDSDLDYHIHFYFDSNDEIYAIVYCNMLHLFG